MKLVTIHIIIGNFVFNYTNTFSVESTWMNQTDTARITLPRKLSLAATGQPLFQLINVGDNVEIKCGYDGELNSVFKGFVSKISPSIPLTIECEDLMWQLKRKTFNFSSKTGNLLEILKELYDGPIDAFDADLGAFRVNANGAKVLEKIKESYGLRSFFRGDKLVCGKIYEVEDRQFFTFNYQKLQNRNLEYVFAKNKKLQVRAISILPDNTKIEETIGDADGDQRTLTFYNVISVEKLKQLANEELARFKYDGYTGSFQTFLKTPINHGDIVTIFGDENNDVEGSYYVDRVVYTCDTQGLKQTITLGPKA